MAPNYSWYQWMSSEGSLSLLIYTNQLKMGFTDLFSELSGKLHLSSKTPND